MPGQADLPARCDRLDGDVELSAKCRDRPELESSNGSFLLTHRVGGLAGGEPGEEPQRDGFTLLVRQLRERGPDRVELLANDRDLVGPDIPVRPFHHRFQFGVVVVVPTKSITAFLASRKSQPPKGTPRG